MKLAWQGRDCVAAAPVGEGISFLKYKPHARPKHRWKPGGSSLYKSTAISFAQFYPQEAILNVEGFTDIMYFQVEEDTWLIPVG